MKNLFAVLCLALLSNFVWASPTLTKELAKQYFAAIKNLEVVQQQFPEINQSFDTAMISDRAEFIKTVKDLPQFSAIEKAATSAGLDDFEQFYDIGMRVMGGMMAVQMEQMPQGMSIQDMFAAQQMAIDRMKAAKLPQEELDAMALQLQEQKQGMESMLKLAASTSAEDKAFARENITWIMSNMPQEEDQH